MDLDLISCPPHLTGAARDVWAFVIEAMAEARTLDPANLPAIERYCLAYSRWRTAEAKLASEGIVLKAPRTGVRMVNPWVSVSRNAAAAMAKLEAELGLSPSRRGLARGARRSLRADGSRRPLSAIEQLVNELD